MMDNVKKTRPGRSPVRPEVHKTIYGDKKARRRNKPDDERRNIPIHFYLKRGEYEALYKHANLAGKSISEIIREALFGTSHQITIDEYMTTKEGQNEKLSER